MAPTYHAVLIGNREFPNEPGLPLLRCPLNDVRAMADLLKAEQHGPYQVSVLEDEQHHIVQRTIYSALKKAGREDRVLIYYAGHGKLSEEDGSLYLASRDTQLDYLPATSVAAADVMKFMNGSVCKQLILILDCCYSGAVDKLLSGSVFRGEVADQIAGNLRGAGGSGSYILTASTSLQRAEEREGDDNGLLTKHLIAGIRDGRADRDDDGLISMHELTMYVQDQVLKEGRQKPLAYTLREEDGGIIIARTGKAARSRKLSEVQDEIYATAVAHRATPRIIRSALNLLVPDPAASIEDRLIASQFVDQLHTAIRDSHSFIEVLEDAPAIVSRFATAATRLQQAAEQQRDDARQQLEAALLQCESLRGQNARDIDQLASVQEKLNGSLAATVSLTTELAALKKVRQQEHQSAETEMQRVLAAQKKLLARERSHSKDQETELNSLRKLIAEANTAIEKLNTQLKKERSEKAALAHAKGDAAETSALKSEIKTLNDKLAVAESAREASESKLIYQDILRAAPQKKLDLSGITPVWGNPPPPTSKQAKLNPSPASEPLKYSPFNKDSLADLWKFPLPKTSRRDALLELFRKYSSEPDFHVWPFIPADLLETASKGIDLNGEEVLALVAPKLRALLAPCYILFDSDTLHWINFGSNTSVRYADIDPATLKRDGSVISVDRKKIPLGFPLQIKPDVLLSLLKDLAAFKS